VGRKEGRKENDIIVFMRFREGGGEVCSALSCLSCRVLSCRGGGWRRWEAPFSGI